MMTVPWQKIVARYADHKGEQRSIRSLETLARRISDSRLGEGLFAWTSMLDLCIVQAPVSYPYDGPFFRISPTSDDQREFRYLDTFDKTRQWHRTVAAEQAWPLLIN